MKLQISGHEALSAAVAEHVCGECVHEFHPSGFPPPYPSVEYKDEYMCGKCAEEIKTKNNPESVTLGIKCKPYATDEGIHHTLAALEKFVWDCGNCCEGVRDSAHFCRIQVAGGSHLAEHQSLPIAICLALLQAHGFEVEYLDE